MKNEKDYTISTYRHTVKESGTIFADDVRKIFPELKESEDEKIRKEIVKFIVTTPKERNNHKKWLAWLEKQGEQKPILPKWKYKNDNIPLSRDSIILNKYGCVAKSPSGALVDDVWVLDYDELAKLPKEEIGKQGEQKPTEKVEPKFKAGDIIRHKKLGFTCKITAVDTEYRISGGTHLPFDFQDAWELVEQKPAELAKGEDYGIDGLYAAVDILQKTLGNVEGYQTDDGILAHKCAISAVTELSKQKPVWSEEDERMFKNTIALIETLEDYNKAPDGFGDVKSWFNSLKERYTWKPSDEQMEALLKLEEMHVLEHEKNQENAHLYMVVKSIREQLLKLRENNV